MSVKAIETTYKGFRFRSRLEARWAVFFDAMKWEWRYEPQGYDIDGEWYLPDFWVDGIGWVEVKGTLDSVGIARLLNAARHLPQHLDGGRAARGWDVRAVASKLLILNDIPDPEEPWIHIELGVDAADVTRWRWAYLGGPAAATLPYGEWYSAPRSPGALGSLATWIAGKPATILRPLRGIPAACTAARSARFEHGEKGAA